MTFRLAVVIASCAVVLLPPAAHACSLIQRPNGLEALGGGRTIAARDADGGSDTTPPQKPALSNVRVSLVRDPCDGRGSACPQLDTLSFTVTATDEKTPVERLRYVAAFGATAAEAAAAEPSLLFEGDLNAPATVTAWLGVDRARSGVGFDRQALCFTIAAVDDAANVSPRSDAICLDTTDTRTATITQGTPCGPFGCGCSGPSGAPGLFLLLALLSLRDREAISRGERKLSPERSRRAASHSGPFDSAQG